MSYKIDEIEGIGPAFREKLTGQKIESTDDLLRQCGTAAGRKKIAGSTGITESQLLKWANMADLMRVSGVGKQYAELLEAAGVDTIKELRTRNAENLASKIEEINAKKKLARTSPATSLVTEWVSQAQKLEPKISH